MAITATVTVRVSIYELARQIYQLHGEATDAAVEELVERATTCDQLDDLQRWAAAELLNKERLKGNKPIYSQAHALRERLHVEAPPVGFRQPTGIRVAGERENMVSINPAPIAALRAVLAVKIQLDRKVLRPHEMTRPEVLRAVSQLEEQGHGCLRNAGMLRELATHMRDGERGIDTLRRLERESGK